MTKSFITFLLLAVSTNLFGQIHDMDSCRKNLGDKKISIYVPLSPGGTFDLIARIYADELARALNTKVTVINNAAVGGYLSLKSVITYEKNAIRLGFFDARRVVELSQKHQIDWSDQIIPVMTYSSDKTIWLSRLDQGPVVETSLIKVAGSEADLIEVKAVAAILNKPYKLISGYSGSSEYAMATLRGEAHYFAPTLSTAKRRFLKSGEYKPVLMLSDVLDKDLVDVDYLLGKNGIVEKISNSSAELSYKTTMAKNLMKVTDSSRMIVTGKRYGADYQCLESYTKYVFDSTNFYEKSKKLNVKFVYQNSEQSKIKLKEVSIALKELSKVLD